MSTAATIALFIIGAILLAWDFARWELARGNTHTLPTRLYFPGAGILGPAPEPTT